MEWWTMQTGTLVGAIGGGGLGTIAGVYGSLAGVLAPRGKARSLVMGVHITLLVLGTAALLAGLLALAMSQPRHVWYPLLLIGGITSIVMGPLLPVIAMRYRQAEARRMDAEELRRGS